MKLLSAGIARDAWYLLFPAHCLGCEVRLGPADYGAICPACRRSLPRLTGPACLRCGLPGSPELCAGCAAGPSAFDAARAALPYEPLVRELVHGFKYQGLLQLRRLFADHLVDTFRQHASVLSAAAIGEVPLHSFDARRRGRNHAAELAESLARAVGIPRRPILRKVRRTEHQAGRSRVARQRNVAEAFRMKKGAAVPDSYLLVDDVLTTGATAGACAAALKEAGVKRVTVITVARTPTVEPEHDA